MDQQGSTVKCKNEQVLNGWMDECLDEWRIGWTNKCMSHSMHACMKGDEGKGEMSLQVWYVGIPHTRCTACVVLYIICIHVAAPLETRRFMANYLLSATRYGWTIVNLLTSRPKMAVTLNSFALVWSGCHCRARCRPVNASCNLRNTGYTQTSPDQCQPDQQLR